jgi:hypothetical protein
VRILGVGLALGLLAGSVSAQHVVINEFTAKGTEWIELYNFGPSAATLTGWYVQDDAGTDNSISGVTIPANGYYTWGTTLSLSNDGAYIELYDGSAQLVDRVAYGDWGGCPVPPYVTGLSACRAPNGADTDDDAADWTLDRSSTQGSANDAPAPMLGSSILVNEIDPYPAAGGDSIEFYNPTGGVVSLAGGWMTDGDEIVDFTAASGSVAPMGWLVLDEGSGDWPTGTCDFASADIAYLFADGDVRVDQLGWAGEYNDYTFQRYPDGAGPHDGYDWSSSGGWVTLFDDYATWGGPSIPVELASFGATCGRGCVLVGWVTQSETDNLGFWLWRSVDAEHYERLNESLISGRGTSSVPVTYQYADGNVQRGIRYYYKLEDVAVSGVSTLHGPVQVVYEAPAVTWGSVKASYRR